ncbi:uncharacterized protein LOC107361417 [Tetranychus urticae]|uniref:Uncharacterized protein n=1 Tax=Tetranychus urticae TaxID=32264 RepID=T1K6W8_TETUR|nr:uncharacterized protein LOC107361417 [Tetranychus urticae]
MGLRRRRRSSASSSDGLLDLDRNGLTSPVKVFYARKKKPESKLSIVIQVIAVVASLAFTYYVYYHFDHFHFNLVHFYATKMDDSHAQHTLAHKLLKKGDNHSAAFHWFRKSASKGHPHSAYNLAAGHLSGYPTDLQKGEAKKLLQFAAKHNVVEAYQLLYDLCYDKPEFCDH